MSQNIVQKLNGLHYISPLLKSPKPNLQKSAVALVGNLSKNQRLQSSMGELEESKSCCMWLTIL